jgi:hypothetical protein
VWYLRTKGWVERLDSGQLAISVLGVDEVEKRRLRLRNDRLLTADGFSPEGAEGQASRSGTGDLLESTRGTFLNNR